MIEDLQPQPLPPSDPDSGLEIDIKPSTSLDELRKRQAAADYEAEMIKQRIKVPSGVIVRVESIQDTDHIIAYTDIGTSVVLHRADAIERLGAMFSLIMNSTGSDKPDEVERDIECCIMIFRAVCKNGESRGKKYSSNYIKQFERMLLDIYKKYKNRPDRLRRKGSEAGWNDDQAPREFEISAEGKIIPITKNQS